MTTHPLLFLHGIRGSRLAIRGGTGPEIIWELAHETHPLGFLLCLHHEEQGDPLPADPSRPVFPLDLEPEIYGDFLSWAAARGPLHAPPWDWRQEPSRVVRELAADLPDGSLDVVVHSMGLHLLGELVMMGALPLARIRRLVLAAPSFGGALDIQHVLLSGCDREADCGDATGNAYGLLVRGFPSLYRLLPVPGYGLLVNSEGLALDPLDLENWPLEALEGEGRPHLLARLLEGARRDRARLLGFAARLEELDKRLLIVSGQGLPTPLRCRMEGPRMSCHAVDLTMGTAGDGRLALAAQRPLGQELPHEIFGDAVRPLAHGEILRHGEVLARIAAFLA